MLNKDDMITESHCIACWKAYKITYLITKTKFNLFNRENISFNYKIKFRIWKNLKI